MGIFFFYNISVDEFILIQILDSDLRYYLMCKWMGICSIIISKYINIYFYLIIFYIFILIFFIQEY